jgi:disulfide oxidoreductase YuzD
LGLSTGYPRLTERLSADLSALAIDPPDSGAPVKKLLANPHTCRACHFIRHAEDKYVREMAERLKEPAYREAYSRSQGVCLRHLAMLMDAASAKETTRYLLVEAARRFAELNEDMQSFAIKRDATRRGLVNKDEEDAYLRTMVHLVGDRYLATAHPADAEF